MKMPINNFLALIGSLFQFMKKPINFFSILLVLIILFLSATVIANYFDIKVDFLNINPSDQHHEKYIDLYYPQNSMVSIFETLPGGDIENLPLFSVHILLLYDGELIEGKKVDVIAVGYVYPDGQKLLSPPEKIVQTVKYYDSQGNGEEVDLNYIVLGGIEGAEHYQDSEAILPFSRGRFPVLMHDYNNTQKLRIFRLTEEQKGSRPHATITWNTQGDYSPFIIFVDSNKTINSIKYSEFKVHVSGSEVAKQEKYARISTWLAIVLFFFTLIESISYLRRLNPDFFSTLLRLIETKQK